MSLLANAAVSLFLAAGSPVVKPGAGGDYFDGEATAAATSAGSPTRPAGTSAGHWEVHDQCTKFCDTILCPEGVRVVTEVFVLPDGSYGAVRTACESDATPKGPTLADIEHAFKTLPMHPSPIHIQPPKGETLVNFDSIFYTDPYTLDTGMNLLGARVDFHITVASYTWHYGDGQAQTTTDPGAAFPAQTITHRYLRKGTVGVTLDTVYQADYSINGGPMQHLVDTVTITSPPQRLTILTATPHLVAD